MKRVIQRLFNQARNNESADQSGPVDLYRAPCGARLRICELCGNAQNCQKLREMGFCENAELQVVNRGGAIVCQIFGCRIGISQSLARSIKVLPQS